MAAGKPLLGWVLDAVSPIKPKSTVVVVGHGAAEVVSFLPEYAIAATQAEQLGTGHATRIGVDSIEGLVDTDTVVVLYGDMPLLTTNLIGDLANLDEAEASMVTAKFANPSGYGRVVRDPSGSVSAIVEDRDCTEEQLLITEINAGVYAFRAGSLVKALSNMTNQNAQGEYYLTDVVGILTARGDKLDSVLATEQEVMGINSQDQLTEAARVLQLRTNKGLMESGVRIVDPSTTYIDEGVDVAPGALIYPGVHLEGTTAVSAGARIGPDVFVLDSNIGENATVMYSVIRGSEVGDECEVGPYASLRPGTILERGSKVGTFVETKNTTISEGAKAPHLSYLGDAIVGARANIGAGTITCNYDGYGKYPTEIGEEAFIGSATMLVAPVSIGDKAVTGAGSVITKDVEDGALAVERGEQRVIPGYAQRRETRQAATDSED